MPTASLNDPITRTVTGSVDLLLNKQASFFGSSELVIEVVETLVALVSNKLEVLDSSASE